LPRIYVSKLDHPKRIAMFSTSEQFLQAARDLFDAQVGLLTNVTDAILDAGVNAAELNADAVKTLMATTTVASRQWFNSTGASEWLAPVAHLVNDGQLELAVQRPN
jgi:hypothetical protein